MSVRVTWAYGYRKQSGNGDTSHQDVTGGKGSGFFLDGGVCLNHDLAM